MTGEVASVESGARFSIDVYIERLASGLTAVF